MSGYTLDDNAPPVEDVVIVGAGGFARELEQWIADINAEMPRFNVLGFLDDNRTGHRILGTIDSIAERPPIGYVMGIGDPSAKCALDQRWRVRWCTVVHPTALLGRDVVLGAGVIVCPNVVVTVDATIDTLAILNLGCTVGHDARIGPYATLAPGVHVSGGVAVDCGAELGTGAVLIPGAHVGAWAKVGAGAVVVDDVNRHTTVVGVPARPVPTRR